MWFHSGMEWVDFQLYNISLWRVRYNVPKVEECIAILHTCNTKSAIQVGGKGFELESLLFWLLCVATQILNLCTLLYFQKEYGYDFCAQSNVNHQRQSNS